VIANGRWTLADTAEFLWRQSGKLWTVARSPEDINILIAGGAGVKMTCLVPWGGGTRSVTRPICDAPG
jgi:hypothetical protein